MKLHASPLYEMGNIFKLRESPKQLNRQTLREYTIKNINNK